MKEEKHIKGLKIKKTLHPAMLQGMKLMRKEDLEITGSFNVPNLIFANHACIDDIPTLGEVVSSYFYLLVSDEDKNTFLGKLLDSHGVKWINRLSKESRIEAGKFVLKTLKQGVDFAEYPEATWNLSPNFLMLLLSNGAFRNAKKAGAMIRPVVTYFTDEKRYSTIGKPVFVSDDIAKTNIEVRDMMATMLYESYEKYYEEFKDKENIYEFEVDGKPYYCEKRSELDPYYWDKYVKKLYDAYPRAKKDPEGVLEYESQFILEPKTDDYDFFQMFNSSIRYDENGNLLIKRISSEPGGYCGTFNDEVDYKRFFGYGYNQKRLKEQLSQLESEREEIKQKVMSR